MRFHSMARRRAPVRRTHRTYLNFRKVHEPKLFIADEVCITPNEATRDVFWAIRDVVDIRVVLVVEYVRPRSIVLASSLEQIGR
jgi:hypothetical protein